jgi:pantoate--beta-alanine ligase
VPRALELGRRLVVEGGVRDASAVRRAIEELLRGEPRARIDYVSVSDSETLAELSEIDSASGGLLLLAVRIGATRLIDNERLEAASP